MEFCFDGSEGHFRYNKKFSDPKSSDANLFRTFIVPIRLADKARNGVIRKNPRPSFTRFCQPVWSQCVQDDTDDFLENEDRPVEFSLVLTMIDAKG